MVIFCVSCRAYSNCSGPGFLLHSDIALPYIVHFGTKEQINKFVPRMVAGTCIGAIAMTEPGAGRSFDNFIIFNAEKTVAESYMGVCVFVCVWGM